MSDVELDVFLAVNVMGWKREGAGWHTRPKHRPSLDFPGRIINDFEGKGEHDFIIRPDGGRIAMCGCDSTASFSPTRHADDAEAVREHWLRERPGTELLVKFWDEIHAWVNPAGDFKPREIHGEGNSLRMAELLAIARSCGFGARAATPVSDGAQPSDAAKKY